MKHIISIDELTEYNTRVVLASVASKELSKKLSVVLSVNNDGTLNNVLEVEVKGRDCFYTDNLEKAIAEYNKF